MTGWGIEPMDVCHQQAVKNYLNGIETIKQQGGKVRNTLMLLRRCLKEWKVLQTVCVVYV